MMTVHLDHLLIPASDRVASARLIATLFEVPWAAQGPAGPFSVVYLNDGLTLDFDQWEPPIARQHYAFRVTEEAFDAILQRLAAVGIVHRSTPHGPADGQVNTAVGGRIAYWSRPDDHVWEILTESYARQPASSAG